MADTDLTVEELNARDLTDLKGGEIPQLREDITSKYLTTKGTFRKKGVMDLESVAPEDLNIERKTADRSIAAKEISIISNDISQDIQDNSGYLKSSYTEVPTELPPVGKLSQGDANEFSDSNLKYFDGTGDSKKIVKPLRAKFGVSDDYLESPKKDIIQHDIKIEAYPQTSESKVVSGSYAELVAKREADFKLYSNEISKYSETIERLGGYLDNENISKEQRDEFTVAYNATVDKQIRASATFEALNKEYDEKMSKYPEYKSDIRRKQWNKVKSDIVSKASYLKNTSRKKVSELKDESKKFIDELNGIDTSNPDEFYAAHGGYKGESLGHIDDVISGHETTIKRLIASRKELEQQYNEFGDTIDSDVRKIKELEDKLKDATTEAEKVIINKQIGDINDHKNKYKTARSNLDAKFNKIDSEISENKASREKFSNKRTAYLRAIVEGKRKYQSERSIRNKFARYGSAAGEVVGDVFQPTSGKRMLANDWFGGKGFLSHPYIKSGNVTEPVKTRMGNLDAITRSTGSAVGRDIVNSVVNIRKNNVVSPLGVPGTIARANLSDRIDYNVSVKRIQPSDVSVSVNRDLLPTIMERKVVPLQMQPNPKPIQYQPMIQPDGSVINVPIQQRKSKYSSPVERMNRGINGVVSQTAKKSPQSTVVKKPSIADNFVNGLNSIGVIKPNREIIPKRNRDVGIFTVDSKFVPNISLDKHYENNNLDLDLSKNRKSKKDDSLVNIISNINNITKRNKKKKV